MKRHALWIALFLALSCLLFPLSAQAQARAVTWDQVLQVFPDTPRETYNKPVYATQHMTWLEFVEEMQEYSNNRIFPMIYDEYGNLMSADKMEYAHLRTGDHIANTSEYDSGELMMVSLQDVVIRGDVIGTGRLTISQLVRLAQALNGEEPLAGLYLEAADVNGDGNKANVADLVTLARWIAGYYN